MDNAAGGVVNQIQLKGSRAQVVERLRQLGEPFSICYEASCGYAPDCERAVRESSDSGNCKDAAAAGKSTRFCKVDSAANVRNWQHRLTADEVRRVRIGTEDVAHHFYADADWE